MKPRLAVAVLTAFALFLPLARADDSSSFGIPLLPAVLSSGYVTPESGTSSTWFTYRVKYWNTANIPPTRIWVAIWWGSRGTRYWYEMQPLDSSDSSYADGAWYTLTLSGLDASEHYFRFTAETGSSVHFWPKPDGTYAPGPTIAGTAVRTGSASAVATTGPQPSVLLFADKAQVSPGDYVTFTALVALPAGFSRTARGVALAYAPDPMFTPLDGAAPALIKNSAILTWASGSVRTQTVTVRHQTRTIPIIPAGDIFVADCGDLAPGDSAVCTFRCRAR